MLRGFSFELVADCAGRGRDESLGVVGRRPLMLTDGSMVGVEGYDSRFEIVY